MEAIAVGVAKAALDGALSYAKSNAAEEIGVERDVEFITDELQMMQSFLATADENNVQSNVSMIWVKQIRNLAMKLEDSLMDFGLHSEKKPSWGFIPRSVSDRRRIATEVKQLRAKVEDLSYKNKRYCLFKGDEDSSTSKPTAAMKPGHIAGPTIFDINEATLDTLEQKKVDFHQLIISEEEDLRVMSVWGTSGDRGKTSAIKEVYDDQEVLMKFGFRAWVRLMDPFNPQEFLRSLVRQFYENSHDEVGMQESKTSVGANIFAKMEKMDQSDLVRVFNAQLCSNSYLIVINDLSTIEDWHCIKMYFPNNKKQSRIIVSTQNDEVASLCTEEPYQVSELMRLSCHQTIYLFHKKLYLQHTEKHRIEEIFKDANEIQQEDERYKNTCEDRLSNSTTVKKFDRNRTIALVDRVLTGREKEKSIVIKLVGQPDNSQKVISVVGMGGLGKTTLVRSVYRSQELAVWKHAWATALHPLNPEVLLRDLALQLQKSIQEDTVVATSTRAIALMNIQELKVELARLLKTQNCLVVLDDISSISEWDLIKGCLDNAGRIIVTTREKNIAIHCSREYWNIYNLQGLKDTDALHLFTKKVSKDNTESFNFVPAMMKEARIILKKCGGLPLAISTICGFLATKPRTAVVWRMMNSHISAAQQNNPQLRIVETVLMGSYNCLPYYLKSPLLYLSIFQENRIIRLDRLVRRWIAEGYSQDMRGITAEQLVHRYFEELMVRSMILPVEEVNNHNGKIQSCQLPDIIREICISKAREENLVFTLEDGCFLSSTQGPILHLVIGSNWKRDEDAIVSQLDLSHVRSLTVFGEWRPFFISENMRFLRVLDLEDTIGLLDHHLDHVGQLCHLKYLSLRGCCNILCLPDSVGNLRHLQTLDVRGTHIFELPTTITKLVKLQILLRTPSYVLRRGNVKVEDDIYDEYHCYSRCVPWPLVHNVSLLLKPRVLADGLTRRDVLNLCRFHMKGVKYGAQVPRGIGQLKALQILCGVNVEGNATVKEFRKLTELRKLCVIGIGNKNRIDFWSAIAGHYHLRSLSVIASKSSGEWDVLDDILGLSPPSCVESLKLSGKLVRVTNWIHQHHNLCKLVLEYSCLEEDDAIQSLGVVPKLAVLRLKQESFIGKQLRFQKSVFQSLVVLELYYLKDLESVLFEEDTMPRLELLHIDDCDKLTEISGLSVLTSLKEVRLDVCDPCGLQDKVLRQVREEYYLKDVIVNTI